MGAPLAVLLGLLLLLAYPSGLEPLRFARAPGAAWAAPLAVALHALASGLLQRRFPRAGALILPGLAVALHVALVFLFHWPLRTWTWHPAIEASPMLSTLAGLLPLLAMTALGAVRSVPRGRRRFALRASLGMTLLPLLGLLLVQELLERIVPLREATLLWPPLGTLVVFSALLFAAALLPLGLRFLFAARPIEAGALRDRLLARCGALGFRPGDLLVARSGGPGGTANAFVAGLLPWRRPVFFTESLLAGMEGEEVEAVLAHEVMHVRRGHLQVYMMLAASFAFLSGALESRLGAWPVWAGLLAGIGGALLFWAGIFGFLSRRFETEADLGAARALAGPGGGYGGAALMSRALLRVAWLNGALPETPSLRHFSIARRIELLARAEREPERGSAFERRCRGARFGISLVFLAVLAGAAREGMKDLDRIEARRPRVEGRRQEARGRDLLDEGLAEEALHAFHRALEAGRGDAALWLWIAEAERALGREVRALEAEAAARRRGSSDPRDRLRLRESP
jgi:Zn-dependent protease with chaperone function